jgi:GT2 family glycosyltransferase
MVGDELGDLAESIRLERLETELALKALQDGGDSLDERQVRRVLESTVVRLSLIEEWLLSQSPRPVSKLPRLRYEAGRIRMLARPRLGRLRHYRPKPLEVPVSYLQRRAPEPAPRISMVTPCFGHGRFIERTLRSVLDQRYPALEYFVQDGGSTDETISILERYSTLLAGWVSEEDAGQADAINRAFGRTSGEIMAWLNSDDLLLPGALAYVAGYFAVNPEVDVVYGNRILIDDHDRQIGAWILPAHDDLALTLADFVPQETLFWRRRVWDAVGGGLDPQFAYALDWDLLLRFREVGATMVRLPRFLGAFRIHEDQKTLAEDRIGQAEMAHLRKRVHGREMPVGEVSERLRPYLRRHVAHHLRQRLVDRLPAARITVPITLPERAEPDDRIAHPTEMDDETRTLSSRSMG